MDMPIVLSKMLMKKMVRFSSFILVTWLGIFFYYPEPAARALVTDFSELYSQRVIVHGGRFYITVGYRIDDNLLDLVCSGKIIIYTNSGKKILDCGVSKIIHAYLKSSKKGRYSYYPLIAKTGPGNSPDELSITIKKLKREGLAVKIYQTGTVFGTAGNIVDTTRRYILLNGPGKRSWAVQKERWLMQKGFKKRGVLKLLTQLPEAEVVIDSGDIKIEKRNFVEIKSVGSLKIKNVLFGKNYEWEKRQDVPVNGHLVITVDADGGIEASEIMELETFLKGILPSEIFSSAPMEALKAQAVAARTEILYKLGTRHLNDPFLVCTHQHCQVYKGRHYTKTDLAVDKTKGLILVKGKRPVNAVFSAICGGHTENNENVWFQNPDSTLRGVSDLVDRKFDISEFTPRSWVEKSPKAFCSLYNSKKSRYRWKRVLDRKKLKEIAIRLSIGSIIKLIVKNRGVSFRIKRLVVVGTEGRRVIDGELRIRRLFGNLPSSAFVFDETLKRGRIVKLTIKGAGWGHGVGLCQYGAIGMAMMGYSYDRILHHYYKGVKIVRLY